MSKMKSIIYLKDADGRVLQTKNLTASETNEFDVENLKEGTYFVELKLPFGKSITHQFNINH